MELRRKLDDAKAASEAGNIFKLYPAIRSIAPKSFRQVVRIHDESGGVLSTKEEHAVILNHFEKLFRSTEPAPEVNEYQISSHITEQDIYEALTATQILKALRLPAHGMLAGTSSPRSWRRFLMRVALATSLYRPNGWSATWL